MEIKVLFNCLDSKKKYQVYVGDTFIVEYGSEKKAINHAKMMINLFGAKSVNS